MIPRILKGIPVIAVPPVSRSKPCDGCVFSHISGPTCPPKSEELLAGFQQACYDANVRYLEVPNATAQ